MMYVMFGQYFLESGAGVPQQGLDDDEGQTGGADLWLLARHDLRSWLQSLYGLGPMIAKAAGNQDRLELEALLNGCAGSLSGMLELLTSMALIETGNSIPATDRLSIDAMAGELAAELGQLALSRGCRITTSCHCGIASGDGKLVRTAARGIVLTAIKQRTQGDIVLRSAPGASGGDAVLEVCFEGIDPTPALSKSAFVETAALPVEPTKPFVGLGLAMIGRLAPRLGGAFTVSQTGAEGWLLTLKLPAARDP